MKAIFLAPNCDPAEITMPEPDDFGTAHYEMLRGLIGGTLSASRLTDDLVIYYHDEGLLLGLPPNLRTNTGVLLAGNALIVRTNDEGDDATTLPEDLNTVRQFVRAGKRPGHFQYTFAPPKIYAGEDFEKYMRGEIEPESPTRILGFIEEDKI